MGTIYHTVFQQKGKHFQQVRLAGAEKSGDPDSVGTVVVVIGIKELIQTLGDLIGEDVFLQLAFQAGLVVGLDNAFNGAIDITFEDGL